MHIVIKLWRTLGKGPNLFKEAADIILDPTSASPDVIEDLIQRLIEEHERLQEWLSLAVQYQYGSRIYRGQDLDYRAADLLRDYNIGLLSSEEHITWRVLQGTFLVCYLIKFRMLFALAPSRFPGLEADCQTLARDIIDVAAKFTSDEKEILVDGLFMSEIVWAARAVIETKDIWSENPMEVTSDLNLNKTIDSWRFVAWCAALRKNLRYA